MARVGEDDVRATVDSDITINIAPFIEAATVLMSRVQTCATDRNHTLTADEIRVITTYLAAHFYAIRDPQYASVRTERAAAKFQGKTAMGLKYTPWGQVAVDMDVSGCLKELDGPKARLQWLGKAPSDQTDYVDRD